MTRTPTLDLASRVGLVASRARTGAEMRTLDEAEFRLRGLHELVLEMLPHIEHAQAQQHRISSEPTPLDRLVQRLREEVGS